ncbi:hypothetical protein KM176_14620 [Pseudooceanicola sp. CBS1P-1]|uniref:Plasmid replication protein C N-terminal domain-containing protein n=1 Tax=Pseudooceanicola albus TaxID=2692189 RepID=A0A6L7G508_9RHOB|nr:MULTISPECIES: helix-turn-helix domain-containing protein [Pseudooceanicola]MBT9385101.1 hypothetical protein [Pseudooceanicola endophyticus]MXN18607.1 hypothetical protein [Pseudooceanicola albus]
MKHVNPADFLSGTGDLLSDPLVPAPRPGHFIVDRWEVLQLVKDTARQTGLGEREVAVLAAHLSVLTKGPVRADQLLISYAQVAGMLDRANCMDERRFRRGEARLEELGFVTRRLSGNARRYPVRDSSGRIVDAYGIDLRPLFLRLEELLALRAEGAEETCRRNALRSRISAALSAQRRTLEARLGALPADIRTLHQDLRNLLRRAGTSEAELRGALRALEDLAPPALPAESAAPEVLPDSSSADAGQSARHSEPQEKEYTRSEPQPASDLHRLWPSLPEVAALYPSPPRDAPSLLKVIFEFSGFLGLRKTSLVASIREAGPERTLCFLDRMAARLDQIRQPDSYLASLSRGAEKRPMTAVISARMAASHL